MKKIVSGVWIVIVLAISQPIWAQWSPQETQLLVLSEIEERIAGGMAFYSLREKFAELGCSLRKDSRVSSIGRAVSTYSDRSHLHYRFYVIEGDIEPQALSLPGGYVLISRSMLQTICRTDDDVAFILGHEIAHSALRHYADYRLRDHQQVAYIKHLIQQHSVVEEEEKPQYSEAFHEVLFPYIMRIRQVKEIEADQFGALYALRAGYQFSASLRVFERLQALFGEEFHLEKDMFSQQPEQNDSAQATHATLSERMEQLELFRRKAIEVSKLFPSGREALDRGNYQEASLIFESILSLFPQSRTAHIGLGVARHLEYWDSSRSGDFLLAYPGVFEIEQLQLLRGAPDFDSLEEAIEEYRMVLSFEPGNKYAANNLGVALAEIDQLDEAETVLRESFRLDPQDFILFNLSLVLCRQSQQLQSPEMLEEAKKLMTDYLQVAPHDQIAEKYLRTWQERGEDSCKNLRF